MNWFTSDLHFGHANIIKYCNRPFKDVEEMNRVLIENWNSVVGKTDTVYHLGDFAFRRTFSGHDGSDLDFESQVNGKVIFLKGNHDSKYPKCIIESMIIRQEGHRIHLNHYPELANPLMMSLVGHVHNKWKVQYHVNANNTMGFPIVNVGIDVWDYRPVSLQQIEKHIKNTAHAEFMETMQVTKRMVRYDTKPKENV